MVDLWTIYKITTIIKQIYVDADLARGCSICHWEGEGLWNLGKFRGISWFSAWVWKYLPSFSYNFGHCLRSESDSRRCGPKPPLSFLWDSTHLNLVQLHSLEFATLTALVLSIMAKQISLFSEHLPAVSITKISLLLNLFPKGWAPWLTTETVFQPRLKGFTNDFFRVLLDLSKSWLRRIRIQEVPRSCHNCLRCHLC